MFLHTHHSERNHFAAAPVRRGVFVELVGCQRHKKIPCGTVIRAGDASRQDASIVCRAGDNVDFAGSVGRRKQNQFAASIVRYAREHLCDWFGNGVMVLDIGSREAAWNGTEVNLGFSPEFIDDQVFVHGLDLLKNFEPLLFGPPLSFGNRVIVIDPAMAAPTSAPAAFSTGGLRKSSRSTGQNVSRHCSNRRAGKFF